MQVSQTGFDTNHGQFEHVKADFLLGHCRIRDHPRGSSVRSASYGGAESSIDAQPSGRAGKGVGFC